ncbi:MAG: hypothetical protein KDN19_20795 [Verrucomicrobiae bacterium]|nr:hypothetical protein [Verrucomicrobiae bacterium]
MKALSILSLSLVAIAVTIAFTQRTRADDYEIVYQASEKKNPFVSAERAAEALEPGYVMPALRAQYDAYVYHYEGLATVRHDEVSSHGIFFYVPLDDPSRVYLGHPYAP